MKKSTTFIWCLLSLMTGVIFGFLLAPVKNGFGNNSGNTNNYFCDPEDCQCDCDGDCGENENNG